MANEATPIILTNGTGFVRSFTCVDGTAIARGALLKLTDPNTAALSATAGEALAGIAASAKEASDGAVTIGAYTNGVFKMYASGSITVGQMVSSAADANFPNYVKAAVIASGAACLGYALETATAGETLRVRVNL